MRTFTITATVLLLAAGAFAEQRFSVPTEFESGYVKPTTQHPDPRPSVMQYVDLGVLIVTLGAASFLALKFRRRWAIFSLMVFCLLYFGFIRGGCICPIGAIQNVAMAIFLDGYALPLIVLVFFVIPLVFTLFFGRSFCGSVCPLGAVQDIFLLRPLQPSRHAQRTQEENSACRDGWSGRSAWGHTFTLRQRCCWLLLEAHLLSAGTIRLSRCFACCRWASGSSRSPAASRRRAASRALPFPSTCLSCWACS